MLKARADCARLVAAGAIRINRQPTDKPHARLRPGDVLTFPLGSRVRVLRILALASRRGPAPEARLLYEELAEPGRPDAPAPCEALPYCRAAGQSTRCHRRQGRKQG